MKYLPLLLVVVLSACHKNQSSLDITTGLVVNIPFDGNTVDAVSGVTGVNYRATFGPDHHYNAGKGLQFNAADSATVDFGALPLASFDSTNQFTISFWVKVADTTAPIAVLSKRGDTGPWEYAIDNQFNHKGFVLDNWTGNGQTSVYGTDPLSAFVAIVPGQWQHLAYVADGNTLSVYVNGVLQAGIDQRNMGYSFGKTSAHLVIGNGGGYGRNYYFNGGIDDIRMYNIALPAATIQFLAKQ